MQIPLRLLIVEDSEDDVLLLLRELQRLNYEIEVERVESAEEMQSALTQKTWDLVLSDYSMPRFNAPQALEVLKTSGLDLPFIIISGTIGEETAVASLKAGAHDFLVKGKYARLGPAIERELREAETRREHKRAEETRAADERRFRALIENAPDGITVVDAKGVVIYVSPSVERILGYSQAEALGRSAFEYVHPEDRSRLLRQLAQLTRKPSQALAQYRFRHKDGSWCWLESTISNLLIAEPGVEAIVFNYRDVTQRKQAEEQLGLSDKILQRVNALVLVADSQGSIVYASPAAKSILGYEPEELLGDNWWKVSRSEPAAAQREKEVVGRVARGEKPVSAESYERPIQDRLGNTLWISWVDAPGLGDTLIGVGHDITERKQAEEKLLASEMRYRRLFEAAKDGILILDANTGEIIDVNPFLIELLGYAHTEFLGKQLWEIGLFKDIVANKAAFLKLQEERYIRYENLPLETKDGHRIWVEFVSNAYAVGDWQVIQCNIRDITKRKQAEELIQRQLKRINSLRAIDIAISSSFDLHLIFEILLQQTTSQLGVDAAAVLLFNPAMQMLEYASSRGFRSRATRTANVRLGEDYAGRAVIERRVIHIPNLLETGGRLAEALLSAKENLVDYYCTPLIVKGEIKGVLEIYHSTLLQPDRDWLDFMESLAGQAAIAIDSAQLFEKLQRANAELEQRVAKRTAELNQLNLELEHANRAKDEFLATMSHELRTPLNSILGLSESLLEQRRDPINKKQQEAVQLIASSGQHLLDLINDILQVSKIEAGKMDIHPDTISIKEVCESSLNFIREMASKKSISVEFQSEPSIFTVQADPQRLKQILVNLLSNAVKFTPEKGRVSLEVNTNAEQDQILFSVTDTGIGIAPDDLKKLFTPFTQLDSSMARQYEGTGLGLVLVYKFTELHGGSVQVESEVGKGSRFTVILPWSHGEATEQNAVEKIFARVEVAKGSSPIPGDHVVILLVDDHESNILVVNDYLQNHGYEVVLAHNGREALEKAEKILPGIILMDIQMPEMDGLEAIRRLRQNPRCASTPIIALTALAMPGDRDLCLQAGANEYMSKPVSLKVLVKIIARLLGRENQ